MSIVKVEIDIEDAIAGARLDDVLDCIDHEDIAAYIKDHPEILDCGAVHDMGLQFARDLIRNCTDADLITLIRALAERLNK